MPRLGVSTYDAANFGPDQVSVPTGDMLAENISETARRLPVVSIARNITLGGIERGDKQSDSSIARFGYLPSSTVSKHLDHATAVAQVKDAGVDVAVPKTGIPDRALAILIDSKKAESRHAWAQANYHGGIAGGAVQLGAELAVSSADPLNVASMFIPGVGEARSAAWLKAAGTSMLRRGAVRGAIGSINGGIGMAALEPLNYYSAQQVQADYTTADSLRNVAFGATLGALLHTGIGGLADRFAKRAGIGAWAEHFDTNGSRQTPDLPEGAIGGGGTRFIDGEDYVRGQFAVIDAAKLTGKERFDGLDAHQVTGESPYADSGAPVVRSDGSVVNGGRRVATIADAYEKGAADDYRATLTEDAGKYGLDPEAVKGMERPVLVRVEGERAAGAWGEHAKANLHATPTELRDDYLGGVRLPDFEEKLIAAAQEPVPAMSATVRAHQMVRELERQTEGELHPSGIKAIKQDLADLYTKVAGATRRDGEYIQERIAELQSRLDRHEAAVAAQAKLDALPQFVRDLADRFDPEQHMTAVRMAIAQAINGEEVAVQAVRHLDGTPAGVERFLAERKASEEAAAAARDKLATDFARALKDGERFDPKNAEAMATEVTQMEADLRASIKGAGEAMDELDGALAEAEADAAQLAIEEKAFKGIELCMMRSV